MTEGKRNVWIILVGTLAVWGILSSLIGGWLMFIPLATLVLMSIPYQLAKEDLYDNYLKELDKKKD